MKTMTIDKTTAVILAAGSSSRMGNAGADKIFADIHGKPVLLYSLLAFQKALSIDEIIVVARAEAIDRVTGLCSRHGITKFISAVKGGGDRSGSARAGLAAINREKGIIAVHDGARPLITAQLIDGVIAAAKEHGAAVPAVLARDTVKKVSGGIITDTPDRSGMFFAQTPQAFDLELYRRATDAFSGTGTDDSVLVERLGVDVRIVDGIYSNMKITSPEDLAIAAALLTKAEG